MPSQLAPFEQMRFEELPATPTRPHRWAETVGVDTVVNDPHFGQVRVHAKRFGQGPPLVLVHGLMTSSYSWRYQLDLLGAHYTLWMPDLPGAGASDCPDVDYRADELADLLARWMEANGLRGARVIGNSLGGYLVLRMVMRHPELVSRFVNLHSPGIPIPRLWLLCAVLSIPGTARVLSWLVARDPERWVHRNVHYWDESLKSLEEAKVWAEPLRRPDGRIAFHRWLRDALDPWAMARMVSKLRGARRAGRRVLVPTLLVYARRDVMVPPRVGDRLAALLPGAELVWMDEASHFAHVDAAERFAAIALPWLREER